MSTLYTAKNYREFIRNELDGDRFGRGARSRLAEHLGVQLSAISLVLTDRQEFSVEHGMKIAKFLGLNAEETEFFMNLLQRDRAGSIDVRQFHQSILDRMIRAKELLNKRIKHDSQELTAEELGQYYGSWFHIAVHMCFRNPENRTPEAIAQELGITRTAAKRALDLLEKLGFIRTERGKRVPVDRRFHLGEASPALRAHLTNWRTAAMMALDQPEPQDLHYSVVMSADRAAFKKIRTILLESVETIDPVIAKAEDREVYALNFDLFKVGGGKRDA